MIVVKSKKKLKTFCVSILQNDTLLPCRNALLYYHKPIWKSRAFWRKTQEIGDKTRAYIKQFPVFMWQTTLKPQL